ncbi:rhodanese domain protein [Legionella beliardensis]|uniref:Rhodanese domain protein n=1 Tax=Legionella beliardensis TaxID=91822 RepID=A0A378I0B3_9GAMM|nr:rhodanese-like domain-containing protein [Legionella beliardensis]STX28599.1 rhodanese domain protein [Legionella beliardensis]
MAKQHSPRFLALVSETKKDIQEIDAQTLKDKLDKQLPMYLIDIREDHEWPIGHIPTAVHMSKGIIERDIETKVPNPTTPIIVYCSGGFRCALVASNLQKMGYTEVYSLDKGLQGWLDAGYSLVK